MRPRRLIPIALILGCAAKTGGDAAGSPMQARAAEGTHSTVAPGPRAPEETVETLAAPIECPAKTRVAGAAPPEGFRVWCENSDGVEHGPMKSWFESGEVKATGSYRLGRMHGTWIARHENGNKRSEGMYHDGRMTGTWQTWFSTGQRKSQVEYDGSRAHLIAWDENGTRRREGDYVDGREVLPFKEWDENGEPLEPTHQADTTVANYELEKTGIPECDAFIAMYMRCIESKMPPSALEQARQAMRQSIDAWRQAARGPARDELARTCQAAQETSRQALSSMGCSL